MAKGLLIDLDNTIIKTKSGETFPKDSEDWQFIDGVLLRLKEFYQAGYTICIITNQGGIEAGYHTEEAILAKLSTIAEEIDEGIGCNETHTSFFYCSSLEGYHRKPNPGMAYDAALEYELNLQESLMVGDMVSDREFALNSGIGTFIWAEDFPK